MNITNEYCTSGLTGVPLQAILWDWQCLQVKCLNKHKVAAKKCFVSHSVGVIKSITYLTGLFILHNLILSIIVTICL